MSRRPKTRNYLAVREDCQGVGLGRLVAEQDESLEDYYVAPERFLSRAENRDDPAVFFMGPKGIGKSAVLQMIRLRHASDKDRIIDITPDQLAFSALANLQATTPLIQHGSRFQWLFQSLWDYVLSLEVLRREAKTASSFGELLRSFIPGSHEKEVKQLLRLSLDDDGTSRPLSTRILELVKELELSADVGGANVAARATIDTPEGRQLPLLSLVNNVARRIHDRLKHPYFVLIDDLDLHWEDAPTQNEFIAALFLSLRKFSRGPDLKCVVAIRNEIFEALPLVDRDKFHDWVCNVDWDAAHVREMVIRRVEYRFACQRSEVWNGVFRPDAFDQMWSHTKGRPREIIRLAGVCIDQAIHNGHGSVDEGDLTAGILAFSGERLTDLASEYRHRFSGLDTIARRMTGWHKEFPFEKLQELCEFLALEVEYNENNAANRYGWVAGYVSDPMEFVRVLLRSGLLMIKPSRTAPAQPYDDRRVPILTRDMWFAVHPMYAPGLGLVGG